MPIPPRSQELGLSYGTLRRILHIDLHLHPYKVQLTHQLKPADHSQCRRYAERVIKHQKVNSNFSNTIFFSDFTLGGYVNKQNSRIWVPEDPQVIEERPTFLPFSLLEKNTTVPHATQLELNWLYCKRYFLAA